METREAYEARVARSRGDLTENFVRLDVSYLKLPQGTPEDSHLRDLVEPEPEITLEDLPRRQPSPSPWATRPRRKERHE